MLCNLVTKFTVDYNFRGYLKPEKENNQVENLSLDTVDDDKIQKIIDCLKKISIFKNNKSIKCITEDLNLLTNRKIKAALSFYGIVSSGKSSLLNCFLGKKLAPTSTGAFTCIFTIYEMVHKKNPSEDIFIQIPNEILNYGNISAFINNFVNKNTYYKRIIKVDANIWKVSYNGITEIKNENIVYEFIEALNNDIRTMSDNERTELMIISMEKTPKIIFDSNMYLNRSNLISVMNGVIKENSKTIFYDVCGGTDNALTENVLEHYISFVKNISTRMIWVGTPTQEGSTTMEQENNRLKIINENSKYGVKKLINKYDEEQDKNKIYDNKFIAAVLIEVLEQLDFYKNDSEQQNTSLLSNFTSRIDDLNKFSIEDIRHNFRLENSEVKVALKDNISKNICLGMSENHKNSANIRVRDLKYNIGLEHLFIIADELFREAEEFFNERKNSTLLTCLNDLINFLNNLGLIDDNVKQSNIDWNKLKELLKKEDNWNLDLLNIEFDMDKLKELFNKSYDPSSFDWRYYVGLSILYHDSNPNDVNVNKGINYGKRFLNNMIDQIFLKNWEDFQNNLLRYLPGLRSNLPELFSEEIRDELWKDIMNIFNTNHRDKKPYDSLPIGIESYWKTVFGDDKWKNSLKLNELFFDLCFEKTCLILEEEKNKIKSFLNTIDDLKNVYIDIIKLRDSMLNDNDYDIISKDEVKEDDRKNIEI